MRGRPRAFDDEDLIRAALEVGPDQLKLSDVAAVLDVPRSTVYNRVTSPDELGALVLSSRLETVLGAGWTPPESGAWRDWLRSWVLHHRAALLEGGPWIRFFQADRHIDGRSLTNAEILLEHLAADGFTVSQAGRAIGLVTTIYRDSAVVLAGLDANDPENEEAQFSYNLERALDGIEVSRTRPGRHRVTRATRT